MLFLQPESTDNGSGPSIWTSLDKFGQGLLDQLPFFAIGLLVLAMTWLVSKIISKILQNILKRTKLRASLQNLFTKLSYALVWILGSLAASMVIFPTLTPGRLLATLGLGSIAIGFAFKDIFENFFAGVLILWRFPLEVGDFISCGDIFGKVEEIWIRMMLIRQTDGQLLLVPNAFIFKNPTRVVTNRDIRRQTVICGVAYDEDVDQCRRIITEAVSGCDTVQKDQPIEIFAQEFGDSSINFEVTWWSKSMPVAMRQSRDKVVAAVKRALDEAGIEIPFPYRTLTFKEPLSLASKGEPVTENG